MSVQRAGLALTHLLRPFDALIADAAVTEILVNGPQAVWVERCGALWQIPAGFGTAELRTMARLVETLSSVQTLDQDGVLEGHWNGWRMTFVVPPVSVDYPCLAMRRLRLEPMPLADWQGHHGQRCPAPVADAREPGPEGLRQVLHDQHNILIAGSTGSGKTTLLASLLRELRPDERVVCLEDSPELPLIGPQQVRLQTRSGHNLRSLLRVSLRLRPDRLVLGEVRGSEAFDLLQAMATGHRGCLGTIHASDPEGALARFEQLILTAGLDWPVEAVRRQIAQSVHAVVQVARTPEGRRITALARVRGVEAGRYVLGT